jgi:antitoxin component of MazEF toxin-antitoxin module
MTSINTTLTTSGNSTAVRIPKALLRMSGLNSKSKVTLEAKQGKIVISKSNNIHEGWATQIKSLVDALEEPAQEFENMNVAANDGLADLPWDGPSFEDWQKTNGKLS